MFYINMAEIRRNFEECKMVLKWYVKFENVVEVKTQWRQEYVMFNLENALTVVNLNSLSIVK